MRNLGGISEITTASGSRGVFSIASSSPVIAASSSLTISGIPVVTGMLTVQETDGSPAVGGVHTIVVTTGTLSDLGNGVVQITTGAGTGGGGVTDHGALTGLLDDDHPQYIRTDGTRTFTGNQSLGGFNLTNVGTVSAGTVTGTTGQFGGTISAQGGNFSHSLTVSGIPVMANPTVSGLPIHVDKLSSKSLGRNRFTQNVSGLNSFVVHSYKVPAGLLGTDGVIATRVSGWLFNQSGNNGKTLDVAIHFGDQVLWADGTGSSTSSANQQRPLLFDFYVYNAGSASLQFLDGHFRIDNNNNATTSGLGNITAASEFSDGKVIGSGTVNTNVDQTLEVRFTHAGNNLGTTSLVWFERITAYSYLI